MGEWEWDGEASSERLPVELEWRLQQWGIYWLIWGECRVCRTEGWRSYSNLQPYSSIKMGALLWYWYSLNTFTWSALRFPVAGPEHDTEYTSPRGGLQGLFDGSKTCSTLRGNVVIYILFRFLTQLGDWWLCHLRTMEPPGGHKDTGGRKH